MSLILLIETSAAVCTAALSSGGKIISERREESPNRHAEVLSVFCDELFAETGISARDLNAVAVSGGPGSYTGLRIGTSTAKGYCYGLKIPLIGIPTTELMAAGMVDVARQDELLCPMIDAGRMEVYSAVYTRNLELIVPVQPVIFDHNPFEDLLNTNVILFSGDGMEKVRDILSLHDNSRFTVEGQQSARHMASLAQRRFNAGEFDDTAYYTPFYLKAFKPGPKRSAP